MCVASPILTNPGLHLSSPPPHTLTFHQVAEEVESQLQKYKAAVDEINAKTGGEHDTDTNGEGGYWGGGWWAVAVWVLAALVSVLRVLVVGWGVAVRKGWRRAS